MIYKCKLCGEDTYNKNQLCCPEHYKRYRIMYDIAKMRTGEGPTEKEIEKARKDILRRKEKTLKARKDELADKDFRARKDIRLRTKYRITLEEYEKLLISQDYRCAICGKHDDDIERGLLVDHSHDTNVVRGFLCPTCNVLIGVAKDSIEILESAINFLRPFQ